MIGHNCIPDAAPAFDHAFQRISTSTACLGLHDAISKYGVCTNHSNEIYGNRNRKNRSPKPDFRELGVNPLITFPTIG